MQKLQQIRSKVTGKGIVVESKDFDLMYWADIFMREYGMSFREFISLNIPTFFSLCYAMEKSGRIGWEQMLIQFMKSFAKSSGKRRMR